MPKSFIVSCFLLLLVSCNYQASKKNVDWKSSDLSNLKTSNVGESNSPEKCLFSCETVQCFRYSKDSIELIRKGSGKSVFMRFQYGYMDAQKGVLLLCNKGKLTYHDICKGNSVEFDLDGSFISNSARFEHDRYVIEMKDDKETGVWEIETDLEGLMMLDCSITDFKSYILLKL